MLDRAWTQQQFEQGTAVGCIRSFWPQPFWASRQNFQTGVGKPTPV